MLCYCSLIKLEMLLASDGSRQKNQRKFQLADIFHIPAQATKELGNNILQVVI